MIDRLIIAASILFTVGFLFVLMLQGKQFLMGFSVGLFTCIVCVRILHGFWVGDLTGKASLRSLLFPKH